METNLETMEEHLATLNRRRDLLLRLKRARDEVKAVEAALREADLTENWTQPQVNDHETLDLSGLVKFKHDLFSSKFSVAQFDSWIAACELIFESVPRQFVNDTSKVIFARHQCLDVEEGFFRAYLTTIPKEDQQSILNNWTTYTNWLRKTRIFETSYQVAGHRIRLDASKQRPGQHPLHFDAYLTKIERKGTLQTDKERAYLYYNKLLPDLQNEIQKSLPALPTSRVQMVRESIRLWNTLSPTQRRRDPFSAFKRTREANYNDQEAPRPKKPNYGQNC
jgi:hypothetical protein